MWDVYNEPGNSHREEITMPHLKKYFEIIRNIDPIQPLTCAVWHAFSDLKSLPAIQKYCLENSDIISYHNYGSYAENIREIKLLKSYNRPIVNTEWLARCIRNNVQEMFPLFYLENIGCTCWGFVTGKYQTYEPWNLVWERYEKDPNLDWDFTKWFHDLYRPSLRPYDPKEIELIKKFCDFADKDFECK